MNNVTKQYGIQQQLNGSILQVFRPVFPKLQGSRGFLPGKLWTITIFHNFILFS